MYGGPVVMMWGMPAVTCLSLMVAASLAEMASAYPTSGAVYYWSWALAPRRCKALACWISGWVLVLGQASFTAANAKILVDLITCFARMGGGYEISAGGQLGIYLGALVLAAAASSTPVDVMAYFTSLATLWNVLALGALCVALLAIARTHQSAREVFFGWNAGTEEFTGITSVSYNAVLGLMMSKYVFLGFDACAHISEETHHADLNAPRGMMASALFAGTGAYLYVGTLCALTTSWRALVDPAQAVESGGEQPVAQLFWNVHKEAYGNGRGGLALLSIPLVASALCVYQCLSANARMLFAFSRDGAVPFHKYVAHVERRTQAPLAGVWLMAALAALIGTPMFFVSAYVNTVETMSVVNTYLAYGIPILCKLCSSHGAFIPGPFSLGRSLSRVFNVVALAWIGVVAVVFSLPVHRPVTPGNMNWNAAGTLVVVLGSLAAYYCPVVGGCHWFTGPRPNLGQFDEDQPRAPAAADEQLAAQQRKRAERQPLLRHLLARADSGARAAVAAVAAAAAAASGQDRTQPEGQGPKTSSMAAPAAEGALARIDSSRLGSPAGGSFTGPPPPPSLFQLHPPSSGPGRGR
ncbi:hypothetical protein HYH03_002056 [Edaphochlamys debaryana]|uniref:Uncharacterized protein n=1 Tax=Edaphochlamys debaryana TaxID=47281 RepID=A0A835YLA4_9CHLO|nr:hypothetical protein HYH03_002056 [Edaphochlamys debaryana]|eukprot:KAG2499759.1 hypothetical protein HYH03_002056 [Edaphochlamys debaryana]